MVEEKVTPVDQRDPTAFSSVSLVIGKIVREDVITGAQLTSATFATEGAPTSVTVPPGLRAISVQVDQVTGAGTLIRTGDYVDALVGFQQFKLIQVDPETDAITPVTDASPTTVKLLLQGLQVVGTLLPPPPADTGAEGEQTGDTGTALTGQQEIVILAGTAQQVGNVIGVSSRFGRQGFPGPGQGLLDVLEADRERPGDQQGLADDGISSRFVACHA